MISRYETSLHSFSFRWSRHIPNSTENPKQPETKPSLSTMPTGEPLDKDDREADALIESLEHQIADITELNEPMVTWDGKTRKTGEALK